jgi:uncharacterized membrane protein
MKVFSYHHVKGNFKLKQVRWEYYLLAFILLFALFIRLYALGSAPFWIDESISALASKNIIAKGIPVLDSGFYYSGAPLFHYSQALFMLLFGVNELAARLVSVVFGLLTIVLAYFIGKEYSKSGGIISALFFAVFYLEVFFSRQARFYQLFQLVFFLSLYLLYKSKEKPSLLIPALFSTLIAIDTHISGLVLVPFFIIHLIINRKALFRNNRFLQQKSIFKYAFMALVAGFLLYKLVDAALFFFSHSLRLKLSYLIGYMSYLGDMKYMLILFVAGSIWAFIRKKELTMYIIVPSLALVCGVFFVRVFAFRYLYFFAFALLLYSAVLFSYFYDKYGKIIIIPILILIIMPSNLFFPYNYVNVIEPVVHNYNDPTAPEIDYKAMPGEIAVVLKNTSNTVIVYFSPQFEWYIRKPDYVLPFSMNGMEEDSVSWNNMDAYSGAPILTSDVSRPYYVVADYFSTSKLFPDQRSRFNALVINCTSPYESNDYKVYMCS